MVKLTENGGLPPISGRITTFVFNVSPTEIGWLSPFFRGSGGAAGKRGRHPTLEFLHFWAWMY